MIGKTKGRMNIEGICREKEKKKKKKRKRQDRGRCTYSYTFRDLVKVLSYSYFTPEEASGFNPGALIDRQRRACQS